MQQFALCNRKYLGSKTRLLPFILDNILKKTNHKIGAFCDIFSGTGVVADAVRSSLSCEKVVTNDLLYSNYIAHKTFFCEDIDYHQLRDCIKDLSFSNPVWGYVVQNYGGLYFTWDNAELIDSIREALENRKSTLSSWVYDAALTSLLYSIDRAANTCGQYDSYLKNIDSKESSKNAHLLDKNVLKPINLALPEISCGAPTICYNEDANQLIKNINFDTLYLDPPYNNRQYSDLYHVLENIALWKKPKLHGKTRKFDRERLKSEYSRKAGAAKALQSLICAADCNNIFLSYSDEGLLKHETILNILSKRGRVTFNELSYPVFGNGAGQSIKRDVQERLYHVEC